MSNTEFQLKMLAYLIVKDINTLINSNSSPDLKKQLRLVRLNVAHSLELRLSILRSLNSIE